MIDTTQAEHGERLEPTSSLVGNRVAFVTIVRKEIRRFMRIWVQTIVPPAVNAILYMLIFGGLIGSRISDMDGFRYLDYIVPGLIMMSVIINSYANVSSSFFAAKMQNYIEEMLVAPISNVTILAGFVIGGVARGLTVGILVSCVALFFSDIVPVHPFITISVALLTSMPWGTVSLFNPVLYMVNGFRYGILGASDIPILHSFIVILVFIAILGSIAMTLLHRGIGIKS